MAEMPDVTAGEHVESAWGNDIRDRSVQRYADSADRDAQLPLPIPGDVAFLEDELVLQIYSTSGWLNMLTNLGGKIGADPQGLAFSGAPSDMKGLWSFSDSRRVLRLGAVGGSPDVFIQLQMGNDSGAGANNTGGQVSFQLRNSSYVLSINSGAAAGDQNVNLGQAALIQGRRFNLEPPGDLANYEMAMGFTSGAPTIGNTNIISWKSETTRASQIAMNQGGTSIWIRAYASDTGWGNWSLINGAPATAEAMQDQVDDLKAQLVALQAQVDAL